jgi:hypothetical protein
VLDADGRALQREVVWSIGAQAPWIADRPVVGLPGAPGGPIERLGFGRVELHASLPEGTLHATFTLVVEGTGPTVVEVASVDGSPEELDLVGWGLEGLAPSDVLVGALPIESLASVDSTRARARIAGAPPGAGDAVCGGTERVEIEVPGARHTLIRPRSGTLELEPGEAVRLDRGASHCLTFPSRPGARYFAGFVDAAAFEAYGEEALPWGAEDWNRVGGEVPLEVSVASRPHRGPPAAALRADFGPRWTPSAVAEPAVAASTKANRADAYAASASELRPGSSPARDLAVGDTVRVRARHCPILTTACAASRPSPIDARVEHVVDGWLAIAVPAGQEVAGWREEVLAERLERLAALGPDAGSGHLERLFDLPRPTTSGSAQLVWITGPEVVGAFASGATSGCSIQAPDVAPLATVLHELAHCFQFAADDEGRATRWALESGADVAAWSLLRARAGQGWSSEVPHASIGGGAAEGAIYGLPFAVASAGGAGTVARWADGYGASALLLDDWIARLAIEAGVDPERATREILLGTLEQPRGAGAGGGLIPRMAAVWPGPFDIADAMLETLVRQALDVQADASPGAGMPWIRLDPGLVPPLSRPAAELDAAADAVVRMSLPHSTWGFVRFDDDDLGGTLELVDGGRLDWVVVRVR